MSDERQDQQDQREAAQQDQHQNDSHETESDDLGDKGKAALKAEREARKAAERERADLQRKLDEIAKKQQEAEDAKAKEQGEWESIAAKRDEEIAELRKQIAERDQRDRRAAIAKAHNIPDELTGLLTGDTDEEMEEVAKSLAKHIAARSVPDNDAGERTPRGAKKTDKSQFADPARWGLR